MQYTIQQYKHIIKSTYRLYKPISVMG